MDTPSEDRIAQIKAQYPERSLHLVDLTVAGDAYQLIMTGPSQDEHKKFTDEMLAARDCKDEGDKIQKCRTALLSAVLAQTRWPERDEVKRIFAFRPEAVDSFTDTLREHAGANAQVVTKKL